MCKNGTGEGWEYPMDVPETGNENRIVLQPSDCVCGNMAGASPLGHESVQDVQVGEGGVGVCEEPDGDRFSIPNGGSDRLDEVEKGLTYLVLGKIDAPSEFPSVFHAFDYANNRLADSLSALEETIRALPSEEERQKWAEQIRAVVQYSRMSQFCSNALSAWMGDVECGQN